MSRPDGGSSWDINVITASGTGAVNVSNSPSAHEASPDWSPQKVSTIPNLPVQNRP